MGLGPDEKMNGTSMGPSVVGKYIIAYVPVDPNEPVAEAFVTREDATNMVFAFRAQKALEWADSWSGDDDDDDDDKPGDDA